MFRKFLPFFLISILLAGFFGARHFHQNQNIQKAKAIQEKAILSASTNPDYLIILVGDSMTEYLGNATELRANLSDYYPGKTFDIYNYGFGATNISTLPDRLNNWSQHGRAFKPILDYEPAIIIIESFGNNPLSQFPITEGLKRQTEFLEQSVGLIRSKRPKTKIVFMSTIAPNKKLYGGHLLDLSDEARAKWVDERIAYIKNHMDYARSHNIHLIDVFDKSKDVTGNGDLKYIEDHNYIHPSPKGVIFIQKEIADFIFNNHLL